MPVALRDMKRWARWLTGSSATCETCIGEVDWRRVVGRSTPFSDANLTSRAGDQSPCGASCNWASLFSGIAGLGAVFALASERAPLQPRCRRRQGLPRTTASTRHSKSPRRGWVSRTCASSTSCHNENGRNGAPRIEYSTWKSVDYHSTAFSHLFDERSDDIMHNLYGIPKTVKGSCRRGEHSLPQECHSSYTGSDQKTGDRFSFNDGVGCESCHGPAEKWLSTHFQAGFKEMSPGGQGRSRHLRLTKDLYPSRRSCASPATSGTPTRK